MISSKSTQVYNIISLLVRRSSACIPRSERSSVIFLADQERCAHLSRYGDVLGSADLCKQWVSVLHGADADGTGLGDKKVSDTFPEHELMIIAGANQGFINVVLSVCDAGDEVLLLLPYYFSHLNALCVTGVTAVCVPVEPRTFLPNVEDIERRITPKSKAVVVVNPGNPSGIEFPQSLIEQIIALCKKKGLWLILDKAYREFCCESSSSTVFTPEPDYFIIKLYTMSKAYGLAGWRVGALLYPKSISGDMRKVQDTIPTHASLVSQPVALAALQHDPLSLAGPGFIRLLNSVRQIVIAALKPIYEARNLTHLFFIPNSAFYFFLPYALYERSQHVSPEGDMSAVDFLAKRHSVVVSPGFSFGMPGYLRISYGTVQPQEAQSAATVLAHGLADLIEHQKPGRQENRRDCH